VDRIEAGIRGVDVPRSVQRAAEANLRAWLADEAHAGDRATLEAMITEGRFDELVDAFWQVLPFGTGGRRGAVGLGPNRLNHHTVASSVQGHAAWLRARHDGELSVVIAYDVRRFDDARGVYPASAPPAVLGTSSRDFAELAASVYAANGVVAHLLPPDADRWMSTPELSYAVRALGASGGLNLSASHNPPDDNGVKVYDDRGSQLVPPHDQHLLDEVARVSEVRSMPLSEAVQAGRVRWLGPEVHDGYVSTVAGLALDGPRDIRLGYTPLHGTGCVHEVLEAAGFACTLYGPQAHADSAFSTVPGHVANPERPEAMQAACDALDVDVVFGTDPDADRIGCEVRHRGQWVHLTGNDIATLVVDQAVRRAPPGKRPLVIKTEVTSELVARVAEAGGAAVVGDLLVGFKYIGQALEQLEVQGSYRGLQADEVVFVAGVEESHGVLITDAMRDKDAAGGALALAELAALEAQRGRTLVDRLEALRHTHGHVRCSQISVRFEGATGPSRMAAVLDALRSAPPEAIGGRRVEQLTDHLDPDGRLGPFVSDSDRAGRNVLVLALGPLPGDEGARVVLRPSGTEPKLKVYVQLLGPKGEVAGDALDDAEQTLREAVRVALLGPQSPMR
jgi:phosphoglucomutase/phosphomannomutase